MEASASAFLLGSQAAEVLRVLTYSVFKNSSFKIEFGILQPGNSNLVHLVNREIVYVSPPEVLVFIV
jgi:hypothetical protein